MDQEQALELPLGAMLDADTAHADASSVHAQSTAEAIVAGEPTRQGAPWPPSPNRTCALPAARAVPLD
jgi:hypothetical protein